MAGCGIGFRDTETLEKYIMYQNSSGSSSHHATILAGLTTFVIAQQHPIENPIRVSLVKALLGRYRVGHCEVLLSDFPCLSNSLEGAGAPFVISKENIVFGKKKYRHCCP